ncbi:hypothetical protein NDU88_006060 [Pleurodeles waltl]|uniref:Uncharacterized protein n=1 Tax=Pleurodeles waltl TaxID=8319 RepID=A0AAV7QMW3_PLEWA|nr:hypothetical protein NDU88_006060 [Pleurodeles waltl]
MIKEPIHSIPWHQASAHFRSLPVGRHMLVIIDDFSNYLMSTFGCHGFGQIRRNMQTFALQPPDEQEEMCRAHRQLLDMRLFGVNDSDKYDISVAILWTQYSQELLL